MAESGSPPQTPRPVPSTARPTAPNAPTVSNSAEAAAPVYTIEGEVHLLDRLAVLHRYRRVAISVFVLTALAVLIQDDTHIKIFRAQAQLLIEDERTTAVPGITNAENTYYEDPEPYYKTQYRILKGRELVRRVIKKIDLNTVPEYNGT